MAMLDAKYYVLALLSSCILAVAVSSSYGVDVSFPIHHNFLTSATSVEMTSTFGHDRIKLYSEFFSGCLNAYKDKGYLCHHNEEQRLELNRMQPPQMTNYTSIGFKKTKVSQQTMETIQDYWSGQVKKVDGRIPWGLYNESWPEGNTYTNHW